MKARTIAGMVSIIFLLGLIIVLLYNQLGFGEPVPFQDARFLEAVQTDVPQVLYIRELPRAKALWDWLELLIVPSVLATVGLLFSRAQRQNDIDLAKKREEAEERAVESRAQEAALQAYLDRMTELLLDRRLCSPSTPDEVREIARVRTLCILRRLDRRRMRYVVEFLHDMGLIHDDEPVVSLQGADFRNARLRNVQLPGVHLSEALLSEATLAGADLSAGQLDGAMLNKADLSSAKLQESSFVGANLVKADLSHADLRGATLVKANCNEAILTQANLRGANLQEANLAQADLTAITFDETTLWPADFTPPPTKERHTIANH